MERGRSGRPETNIFYLKSMFNVAVVFVQLVHKTGKINIDSDLNVRKK